MDWDERQFNNHIIVCGLGALGESVCLSLVAEKRLFVCMDMDAMRVQSAVEKGWIAIQGDVTEPDIWQKVGLPRAHSVISTLVDESDNVYVILMVREQHPDCFIVTCGATRDSEGRLKRVGANRVISPFLIGGAQMAHTALRPTAIQFIDLAFKRDHVDLEMDELTVPEDSSVLNSPLSELYSQQELADVIVVGFVTKGGKVRFNPKGDTLLSAGDQLICLGNEDDLERFRNALK